MTFQTEKSQQINRKPPKTLISDFLFRLINVTSGLTGSSTEFFSRPPSEQKKNHFQVK